MTHPRSDRELRRSILKLRSLRPSDFDAVLDSFDESQRNRALALLAALDGVADAPSHAKKAISHEPVLLPEDLSPWLAARVNGREDSGEETVDPFSITEHAQAALRRCAAALVPQPPKAQASSSLLDRIMRGFT